MRLNNEQNIHFRFFGYFHYVFKALDPKHEKNYIKNKIHTLEKEIDKIENSQSEQINMNLKKNWKGS